MPARREKEAHDQNEDARCAPVPAGARVSAGRLLVPSVDQLGLRHACVIRLNGGLDPRVCELHAIQAQNYVNPALWTFQVTCLWCLARLARA